MICSYKTVLSYDVASDSWSEMGSLLQSRRQHVVVEVPADAFCSQFGYAADIDDSGAEGVQFSLVGCLLAAFFIKMFN